MALSKEQKVKIEEVVKSILLSRLENFPDESTQIRNAPFHAAFLECFKERIKPLNVEIPYLVAIASWLHGLNTSLGSGFENLAHILSGGFKRKFSGPYVLKVKKTQVENIETIIRDLKAGSLLPESAKEEKIIFNYTNVEDEVNALSFTADNYIENETGIEAVEMKSVRPNSGEAQGEKRKILYAKAAFKLANPAKEIKFFLGFPFDPTSEEPTKSDKKRFFNYLIEFKKFFAAEEVLLGDELWNRLSGTTDTMEEILDIINDMVKRIQK